MRVGCEQVKGMVCAYPLGFLDQADLKIPFGVLHAGEYLLPDAVWM